MDSVSAWKIKANKNKSEEYFSKFPHLTGVISLTITSLPGVKIRSLI